jgi:hypothetical protein
MSLPSFSPIIASVALMERARELCSMAADVTDTATRVRADTRLRRRQRRDWDAIWEASQSDPHRVLHSCAYCHRMKAPSGEWVAIPLTVSKSLRSYKAPFVSHGFCPDCIATHFPESLRQELLDEA